MSTEIPVPANTPAIVKAERANDRWVKLALTISMLTLLGVVATLWLRFGDAAKQSTTQHAATAILQSGERADCRTAYNSDRNVVIEHAQIVERQNVSAFGGYLLSQGVSTADLVKNKAALDAANKAVADLPTLNDMVDHGYTLGGVTHPPCPKVN